MEAFGAWKELEFVATGTREKGVAEACVGAALLLGWRLDCTAQSRFSEALQSRAPRGSPCHSGLADAGF